MERSCWSQPPTCFPPIHESWSAPRGQSNYQRALCSSRPNRGNGRTRRDRGGRRGNNRGGGREPLSGRDGYYTVAHGNERNRKEKEVPDRRQGPRGERRVQYRSPADLRHGWGNFFYGQRRRLRFRPPPKNPPPAIAALRHNLITNYNLQPEDIYFLTPQDCLGKLAIPSKIVSKFNFIPKISYDNLAGSRQLCGDISMQMRTNAQYFTVLSQLTQRGVCRVSWDTPVDKLQDGLKVMDKMLDDVEQLRGIARDMLAMAKIKQTAKYMLKHQHTHVQSTELEGQEDDTTLTLMPWIIGISGVCMAAILTKIWMLSVKA